MTYVRYEVEHGVTDQCADSHTKHPIDGVLVSNSVTAADDQQSTQRDDGDDSYGSCSVAVDCHIQTYVSSMSLIACSHRRHGQDKTVLSCLARVGCVNKPLQLRTCLCVCNNQN